MNDHKFCEPCQDIIKMQYIRISFEEKYTKIIGEWHFYLANL